MKKILLCLLVAIFGIACNNHGTVSEAKLKKALNITYQELPKMNDEFPFYMIKNYFTDKNYLKGIECKIVEQSDVDGTIYLRACLLKNVNKRNKDSSRSPHVLVFGLQNEENKDQIRLIFCENAEKTKEGGFSYSTLWSFKIRVNLETHKIGAW